MAKRASSCSIPNLDRVLDRMPTPYGEVTIDAAGCTQAQVERIYAHAKARGFHASGTWRWILIRQPLRHLGRTKRRTKLAVARRQRRVAA
jgi:hypothetical protein